MDNTTSSTVLYNLNIEVSKSTIYIYPIMVVLIFLSNILNILVLSRRSLRTSPCTHYFLALAIDSLVYMTFTPLLMFLSIRFGISLTGSPFGCRIYLFCIYSSGLFFVCMLVCASIDRFCASSSFARLRKFSSVRVAQRVIIIVTILVPIYISPFCVINYWDYNTNKCSQYSTTLIVVYLTSRVMVYYIIGPLFTIIFGLLTIKNIQNQRRRVAPIVPQHGIRRTEGQLTRVLIIQVGIHVFFSLPVAVVALIQLYLPSLNASLISGIRTIAIIWQQPIFFLSFFTYTLSSTVFRTEFLKIFKLNHRHNERMQPVVLAGTTRFVARNIMDTRV